MSFLKKRLQVAQSVAMHAMLTWSLWGTLVMPIKC